MLLEIMYNVIIGMFIMIRYKYNCCLDLYVFIGYFGDLVNVLCWFSSYGE